MTNVIDWSKYGRAKRKDPKWEVTYEGNARGDGIRITAVFETEDLDEVVASIRRQIQYWKDEPK
ncbi:hypothetical protein [Paraburkholderia xenovorans]|uniref:hypothetical protein n=1 Tax=Paraburkholderia xenovorans TaxID=36873 RepID=UPI0015C5337A|nr:hypothetical protein [Paraburkholderia xenovorans]NPT36222.1 hypothetical protein [Paraburkholderia xenovorans]